MIRKSYTPTEIITAIDLGSSHCRTLIAQHDPSNHHLKIMGVGNIPTKGVRRSNIVNLEEATATLENSLATAEKICGTHIENVYLSISGQHISSQNSSGVAVVLDANEEITESDIDRAIESARAVSLPADREILNLTPRFFTVDGQDGIRDPMGMVGTRLEVDIHLIIASSSAIRNAEKALSDVGLTKEGFVFSGYAASEIILTEAEKEAGAVCIDIGSDTTSFCAYVDGAIQYSGVIPIGGRYVSQDINAYTHIGIDNAERLKLQLSEDNNNHAPQQPNESREEYRRRFKNADLINLSQYDPNIKPSSISRSTLIRSVIVPRLKEIFSLVHDQLQHQQLCDKLGAGAVIVGGGAKTVALVETATRTLGMQVKIGVPTGVEGVIKHINDPIYATAVGLLQFAVREQQPRPAEQSKTTPQTSALDKLWHQIGNSFKNIMP